MDIWFEIEDVVDVWVESDYYANGEDEIKINSFILTRLTERALDVQLFFNKPEYLT